MEEGLSMRRLPFQVLTMILITVSWRSTLRRRRTLRRGRSLSASACPAIRSVRAHRTRSVPEQNGLDGRKSGTVAGYTYSQANKNSGIVWNDETFKEYIADPRAKIPGTKMIFPGIKDPKEATDLWAYIKQFDAEGNIKK